MDRYIDMAFIQERKFTMQRTCVIGIGLVIHIYLFYKKWKSSLQKPIITMKIPTKSQSGTYGNSITIEATVDSSPEALDIKWKKKNYTIKPDGRKFIIDESNKAKPTLTILCLDFDDSGNYTISATNALGSTEENFCINVKGDNIIFISGPVVVLPAGKILFRAVKPPNIKITREEWYNTNNNITRKIKSEEGIFLKPDVSTLEIDNATTENSGTYQLSVESSIGTLKSNTITVFVDDSEMFSTEQEGNCLRFYALQSECKETMRKTMDRKIRNFSTTWTFYLQRHAARNLRIGLPGSRPISTSELDVSLMYSMIRNTFTMPSPSKGWGNFPDANDINISDDIERIRHYRNKISHENSSEMTTEDFNTSVLDLIMAIRRITANDEKMLKQLCGKLKMVFYQGSELKKMMEKLDEFRRLAAREEQQLNENDDSENIDTNDDEHAIKFIGCNELYLGEKAKFTALIDPKISKLCNLLWKRTDERGYRYTIDINDGKYKGSTLTFPSPKLHIHFVRKQDMGTYRLFVDTFNKVVHNSVKLVVKEGECDEKEEGSEESQNMIGFHSVHDADIALLHDNTIARKTKGELRNALCFTNRSLQIEEKIYIRIAETHAKWSSSMDFGLTNKNPSDIVFRQDQSIKEVRKTKTDEPFNYLPDFNDVLCFTLKSNATLSFSVNGIIQRTLSLKHVSINNPVWLCFDLYGKTRAIEISNKNPKTKPYDSFAREYSF